MTERILLVGYDQGLLFTRACILNSRWSTHLAYPSEALNMLEKERFHLIVLCHTLPPAEAASLASVVRASFPKVSVLTLEALTPETPAAEGPPRSTARTGSWATASTLNGPTQMLDAIEALLDRSKLLGPKLPDLY